jgi:protein PhnA
MENLSPCPKCQSEYTYEMDGLMVCPDCGHEWDPNEIAEVDARLVVKDANGVILANGDSVVIAKDLPVKGAPKSIKAGTKVKNIRLVEGDHNIDCKIEGFGSMALKEQSIRCSFGSPTNRSRFSNSPPFKKGIFSNNLIASSLSLKNRS